MAELPSSHGILVAITRDGMGQAPPELAHKLLRTWLTLVLQNDRLPGAICFYTEGVRLVVEGSPVLDLLQTLEARGVRLVICSTCLGHYGLSERVRVGIVGGMTDILAAQWMADKVIAL